MGTVVNTGLDNGFSGSSTIGSSDPHWNWTLGEFYVDGFIMGGEEITRADKQLPFHQPHYILVNLALSKPKLETFRTADYIIDYVRVYK